MGKKINRNKTLDCVAEGKTYESEIVVGNLHTYKIGKVIILRILTVFIQKPNANLFSMAGIKSRALCMVGRFSTSKQQPQY